MEHVASRHDEALVITAEINGIDVKRIFWAKKIKLKESGFILVPQWTQFLSTPCWPWVQGGFPHDLIFWEKLTTHWVCQ